MLVQHATSRSQKTYLQARFLAKSLSRQLHSSYNLLSALCPQSINVHCLYVIDLIKFSRHVGKLTRPSSSKLRSKFTHCQLVLQDGDTAAVAEKLDDLQGAVVYSLTGACPDRKLVCIVFTSFTMFCLYAFAVGEDGDILNLGDKKKKKKKKQTSEVVVRSARSTQNTELSQHTLPEQNSKVIPCCRKMPLQRQQLEVKRKQTSFLSWA